MSSKGYIELHREIIDWEWFNDVYVLKLFIFLILEANHKEAKYMGIQIPRGSLLTSVAKISQKSGLSVTSVKNSLKKLLSTGEIAETIKPNKYRIITINNYDKFQSVGSQKANSKTNSKADKKTNSKTTNNKVKKSVYLTDKHSEEKAKKPRASSALVERPGGGQEVTLRDVRQYQIDNRVGNADLAAKFFHGFEKSGTKFPDNWQTIYWKCAHSSYEGKAKFFEILNSGGYRKKWGAVGE